MFTNGICPNCECDVTENCCGDSGPYEMDDIAYCCRACAEDEECTCGCQAIGAGTDAGDQSGATPGPTL